MIKTLAISLAFLNFPVCNTGQISFPLMKQAVCPQQAPWCSAASTRGHLLWPLCVKSNPLMVFLGNMDLLLKILLCPHVLAKKV